MHSPKVQSLFQELANNSQSITVLTGAGISAESGIPTFRGPEGYWTVGSKVYQPQEIATLEMFLKQPKDVWNWFLYRRSTCNEASPNPGHLALVEMEKILQNRFTLITQNVDGLHLRAGNSLPRTYQIHGNIDYMRCSQECSNEVYFIPKEVFLTSRDQTVSDEHWKLLRCPACGDLTRPHVLWWDECYNEEHYSFDSSIHKGLTTDILLIIGTSGAANLPNKIAHFVASRPGTTILDINPENSVFSDLGLFLQGPSGKILPKILKILQEAKS